MISKDAMEELAELRARVEQYALRSERGEVPLPFMQRWQNLVSERDAFKGELDNALKELATVRLALEAILKDPYGCPFCDSGKLRPTAIHKGHSLDCGYELARAALKAVSNQV